MKHDTGNYSDRLYGYWCDSLQDWSWNLDHAELADALSKTSSAYGKDEMKPSGT